MKCNVTKNRKQHASIEPEIIFTYMFIRGKKYILHIYGRGSIEYFSPGSKHHTKNPHFMEETCIQRRRLEYIPRNTELRGRFRHACINYIYI